MTRFRLWLYAEKWFFCFVVLDNARLPGVWARGDVFNENISCYVTSDDEARVDW